MDWDAVTIPSLQLTETELRYYGDIFIYCCENSDTDTVPIDKVAKLLRSADLPFDITLKIILICGEKKDSHFGRIRFYAALKLVAAHQAGIEVHSNAVTSLLDDIALPKFTWSSEEEAKRNSDIFGPMKGGSGSRVSENTTQSESEAESLCETGGSTDSPTPTNSVTQERNEGILGSEAIIDSVSSGWQGLLVSEEQRQLLGTEEESSERHSSDEGDGEDDGFPPEEVWIINDEQRDYYAAQFTLLQPDPEGLLTGPAARTFFEKSRLPVADLRRIWQLADVTRDGALSLQEFLVAMHLVVLRRNHVPLPDVLPPSLSTLLEVKKMNNVPAVPPGSVTSPPTSAYSKEKSKEWTKFVDSPTGTGSLTSPGPKPVNFDFQKAAVEKDPRILHPVPLRLTPEAAILASSANGGNGTGPNLGDDELQILSTTSVQRPLAKKPPPPPEENVIVTPKKEPPPPPPPRPYRTHARSSSLDLNKLGKNGQSFLGAPPLVPPRISPGITSPRKLVGQKSEGESQRTASECQGFIADFSQFTTKQEVTETEVIDSVASQQFAGVCGLVVSEREGGQGEAGKNEMEDCNNLTLQELREKNAELRQVCEELTKELAGALQERINLRAKLLLLT